MTTQTMNATQEPNKAVQSSKTKDFMDKQVRAFKYIFKIDQAFPYMIATAVLFGLSIYTKTSNYIAGGHNGIYQYLLLAVAAVLGFRACQRSMTPAALMLLVGFGGQYLLSCHICVYLAKEYLQYIASAGVLGLATCCFYRMR